MKTKNSVLFLAIIVNSGFLFVNVYNSMVDAPNWGSNIPATIDLARNYFTTKKPADFFKIFGIVIHILGINGVIRFWKVDKQIRLYNISALSLIFIVDLLTFTFFFPRNDIMFNLTSNADIQTLTNAWNEWKVMNWVRSFITVGIVVLYSLSLKRWLSNQV
jgi:hypothetical protein